MPVTVLLFLAVTLAMSAASRSFSKIHARSVENRVWRSRTGMVPSFWAG